MSSKFSEEDGTPDINLGIIGMKMIFKIIKLVEII